MLSGHYSFTYNHPQNWLVLILMMFAGAAIRQFFVMRHGYKLGRHGNPLVYGLAGVAVIVGAIVWLRPVATPAVLVPVQQAAALAATGADQANYQKLQIVLQQRCYACHGEQVQMKNVRLDSASLVKQQAQSIYQQVVVSRAMPMNNSTGLTEAERQLVKQWFEAGAAVD